MKVICVIIFMFYYTTIVKSYQKFRSENRCMRAGRCRLVMYTCRNRYCGCTQGAGFYSVLEGTTLNCKKLRIDQFAFDLKHCSLFANSYLEVESKHATINAYSRFERRRCRCLSGYHVINQDQGSCEKSAIGSHCDENDKTPMSGFRECSRRGVRCKRNYFSSNNMDCVLITNGTKCHVNRMICEQADLENFFCLETNLHYTCDCESSYMFTNRICKAKSIGDPCKYHEDCKHQPNSLCGKTNICVCKDNHIMHLAPKCLPRTIGDECIAYMQCRGSNHVNDMICNDKVHCNQNKRCLVPKKICQCDYGYGFNNQSGICEQSLIDKKCDTQNDCSQNNLKTVCNQNNVCKCSNSVKEGNSCVKVQLYGDCYHNDEMCGDNAKCTKGICRCISLYMPKDNRNCQPVILYTECSRQSNCHIPNTKCNNGVCSCENKYINSTKDICTRRLIGQPCRWDDQCMENARCNKALCECNHLYFADFFNRNCVKMDNILGTKCVSGASCSVENSTCSSNPEGIAMCSCNPAFYKTDSISCTRRLLGDPCEVISNHDNQCSVNNSHCLLERCACKHGFRSDSNTCVQILLGDKCSDHQFCSGLFKNSKCYKMVRHQVCRCSTGYRADPEYKSCDQVFIGMSCHSNSDCKYITNSFCDNRQCFCISHYTNYGDNFCVKVALGSRCPRDDQPTCEHFVMNTICSDDICRCQLPFSEFYGTCVIRAIGDSCTKDKHCTVVTQNSYCKHNIFCSCRENFVQVNGTCIIRTLGMSCSYKEQCKYIDDSSTCSHGEEGVVKICTCQSKYLMRLVDGIDRCVKFKLNDQCNYHYECRTSISNSQCHKKKCTCYSSFAVSDTICKKYIQGDDCTLDKQCRDSIWNTKCGFHGKCVCPFRWDPIFLTCQIAQLNDECETDSHCSIVTHAVCTKNKCTCTHPYDFVDVKLHNDNISAPASCALVGFNKTCNFMCSTPQSSCINNVCACKHGYKFEDNVCVAFEIVKECISSETCQSYIKNTKCTNNLCSCEFALRLFKDKLICKKLKIEDSCESNNECAALNNSICQSSNDVYQNNKLCVCNENYDFNEKMQCEKVLLGSRCKHACFVKNSECVDGRCKCKSNYYRESNTICQLYKLGSACLRNDQCQFNIYLKNSSCYKGRCVCKFKRIRPQYNNPEMCIMWTFAETCNMTDDCNGLVNVACIDGDYSKQCLCKIGYDHDKSGCNKRLLGDACDSKCYTEYSVCKEFNNTDIRDQENNATSNSGLRNVVKICACSRGFYKLSNNECRRFVIGTQCTTLNQCNSTIQGSLCVVTILGSSALKTCKCPQEQPIIVDSKCTKSQFQAKCKTTSDCNSLSKLMVCVKGKCDCQEMLIRGQDGQTECIKRGYSSTCFLDTHCSSIVKNSVCNQVDSSCTCPNNTSMNNNRDQCITRALYDDCKFDEQCLLNIDDSQCFSGTCMCEKQFKETKGKCLPRLLNDSCNAETKLCWWKLVRNITCDVDIDQCVCIKGRVLKHGECVAARASELKSQTDVYLYYIYLTIFIFVTVCIVLICTYISAKDSRSKGHRHIPRGGYSSVSSFGSPPILHHRTRNCVQTQRIDDHRHRRNFNEHLQFPVN